jgi:hypothetical protein
MVTIKGKQMTSSVLPQHDPGGKVRILLPDSVIGAATFGGHAKEYRYRLSRTWGEGPCALFIMMNPSTADPLVDDPSVAKCRRFAVKWGYGSLCVGNTFAYRATDQRRLTEVADPIGPENDRHLLDMASEAALVVFAYGKPKARTLKARGLEVARMLRSKLKIEPYVLRLTLDGTPSHPLYLPETLKPTIWKF